MKTRGEGHVRTQADIGVRSLRPKHAEDCQEPQKLDEAKKGPPLELGPAVSLFLNFSSLAL